MQDERHSAEYDPITSINLADTLDIVNLAGDAMAIFDALKGDERAAILALMLAPGRS